MSVLEQLRKAVGEQNVLVGDLVAGYDRDWTGAWRGDPLAVVRPATTDEVSAVVTACAQSGVPLVPQGGNTGLVGAASPSDGEVVLSTSRLMPPSSGAAGRGCCRRWPGSSRASASRA